MAIYKKNTRRKVVKGKKMKRSVATRRNHKKSKGRRSRRRGGIKGPRPAPILQPSAAYMARNTTTAPSTAVALDRRGQDVLLHGSLLSPMPETAAARNEKVSGRITKGFDDAFAAAEARKAEQAQLMD